MPIETKGDTAMTFIKTGLLTVAFALAASLASADSSVPVQGTPVLKQGSAVPSAARFAFAQVRPVRRSAIDSGRTIRTGPDPYVRLQLLRERDQGSWNR